MRLSTFLTFVLAVAAGAGAIAIAEASDGEPASTTPVMIDRCRLEYNSGLALTKTSGALQIKFTNEGNAEAQVVRFAVDVDGKTASVRDMGHFAPGVTIDHRFKDYAGDTQFVFSRQPQPVCRVTYVKYADGTAWEAGATHAPATAAATAAAPSPEPSPAK